MKHQRPQVPRARHLPLWLLLVAFLGNPTMAPVVWGSLLPRESDHESNTSEEVLKWAVGAESRAPTRVRKERPAGWTYGLPRNAPPTLISGRMAVASGAPPARG